MNLGECLRPPQGGGPHRLRTTALAYNCMKIRIGEAVAQSDGSIPDSCPHVEVFFAPDGCELTGHLSVSVSVCVAINCTWPITMPDNN